jgi:hypothetical protein
MCSSMRRRNGQVRVTELTLETEEIANLPHL